MTLVQKGFQTSTAESNHKPEHSDRALSDAERLLLKAIVDLLDRVERNGGLGEYKGGAPFAEANARKAIRLAQTGGGQP